MHYYKRNIGDYAKKAAKLKMIQHGAYTLLLDAYYDRERAPTLQEAIEWCWAETAQEVNAVKLILKRFFIELEGRFYQTHADEEIAKYRERCEFNQRVGRRGGRPKNPTETETVAKRNPTVTLTTNHEPLTTNHKPNKKLLASGEAVITFEEFWNEYPRKTAKAVALKSWLKLSEPDRVLAKNALHSHRQRWVDPQFIPHASTWLNQRRFEDVLTVKYTAPDLMPKEKAPELTPEQERIEDQRQGKIALSRMAEMSTGDQLDKLSIATNVKRNEGEDDKSYRLRMIEKIKS